ncbi:MAG: hypothetical protein JXP34_03910 [Planctomycetes bacterium]|nr:hypothetical protein [Planctomycetota bacterium]
MMWQNRPARGGLMLPPSALDMFDDRTILRDPRGRSLWPSLVPFPDGRIGVRGPFLVHQVFRVSRSEGLLFVDATGDENPIHRRGDVIPGALTGAKALATLEVLFPRLAVSAARFKFRGIGTYDRVLRNQLAWTVSGDDRVSVHVRTRQEDRLIAEGEIGGTILPEPPRVDVKLRRGNRAEIDRLAAFLEALRIRPAAYLLRGDRPHLAYPRAFLLSLPSGEMVRRFEGQGGILSVLDLEFPETDPVPVVGGRLPAVELVFKRAGSSFSKILTTIRDGVAECCRGFALVVAPGALPA